MQSVNPITLLTNHLALTRSESIILKCLMDNQHPGDNEIMAALYGEGKTRPGNVLKVFICHLRKKLKAINCEITNIWGRGYYLPDDSLTRINQFVAEGGVS